MRSKRRVSLAAVALAALAIAAGGCELLKTDKYRFLNPTSLVQPPEKGRMPINPILPSASSADQAQEILPGAAFPTDEDLVVTDKDYVIGPTDQLIVFVLDLYAEGQEARLDREVSETGYVDLPLLPERYKGKLKASGLTKDQLKDVVAQAYTPDVLRSPSVSITVAQRRQNTYVAVGAVQRPGSYMIMRNDMRLLDAMGLAGYVTETNIRYIYVIRQKPPEVEAPQTAPAAAEPIPAAGALPATGASTLPATSTATSSAPTSGEGSLDIRLKELEEVIRAKHSGTPVESPMALPSMSETGGDGVRLVVKQTNADKGPKRAKWTYSGGQWIKVEEPAAASAPAPGTQPQVVEAPVEPGMPEAPEPPVVQSPPQAAPEIPLPRQEQAQPQPEGIAGNVPIEDQQDPFGWKKAVKSDQNRVIAISMEKLQNGDPKMNIVVRDKDVLYVPISKRSEFYVTGEVYRSGPFDLTGRKVTVKQALAAAGPMTPLAWPENCLLVRRLSDNQEQIIPLNVEAIYAGREPDLYLKPDDTILVGTNAAAPFLAVMRNAFRLTYGFGFIYDRNFADPYGQTLDGRRFSRW